MLDIKFIRENYEEVRAKLLTRYPAGQNRNNLDEALEQLMVNDKLRRDEIKALESLQQSRNQLSKEIGMKRAKGEDADDLRSLVQEIKEKLDSAEKTKEEAEQKVSYLIDRIPNIPDATTPIGDSEDDNVEVRRIGEVPAFDFEPKQHFEIGEKLGILDLERAAKLSGARFSVLKGAGAKLERALENFMLDEHTKNEGYTEFEVPLIVSDETLYGSGQLPKFQEDLFHVEWEKPMYLIPTSEVPLVNLHRSETFDEKDLPLRYTALTPCFRSEAGSYGKDTRGIIRVHQFYKVEMVNFTTPEKSMEALETMTENASRILQKLGIAHRVVALCTSDMGFSACKTYDVEVWLPGQNTYREISSCSNCWDFQARRANIRYRPADGGKPQYVHTLNGSGLAVGRTWVAVLENYQQKDGSVIIPEVLRPYMDGLEIIEPEK
ncbi:serine--tRNA ligase [bacterium]|nr:serine--tRNA ligase [bacterium]